MLQHEYQHLREQRTVSAPLAFVGIGLHCGNRVTMRILPAAANTGIVFTRRDLPEPQDRFVATWTNVTRTELSTTLGNPDGHELLTVEHLLSALSGLGIDNADIVVDGAELPVMDGSAHPYVEALINVGSHSLGVARDVLVVRRPVRVQQGECWAELVPDCVPRVSVSIAFDEQDIGHQCLSCCVSPTTFKTEIAAARTFGFAENLWHLRRRGLARGGSIRNAILLENGHVTNLEGLRYPDEFVRHKALDAIGDLALSGFQIIGHYRAKRPGHWINNELVRQLMTDPANWERMPGSDWLAGAANRDDPTATEGDESPIDNRTDKNHPDSGLRDMMQRVFRWTDRRSR